MSIVAFFLKLALNIELIYSEIISKMKLEKNIKSVYQKKSKEIKLFYRYFCFMTN